MANIFPYAWFNRDEFSNHYIYIFGYDENKESSAWRIQYYPWFYVRLIDGERQEDVIKSIKETTSIEIHNITSTTLKNCWYYPHRTHNLLKLQFKKASDMSKAIRELKDNFTLYEHESNTSTFNKFITEYNLPVSDWICSKSAKLVSDGMKVTKVKKQYLLTGNYSIDPVDSVTKKTLPMADPSIAAFDIETYSHNHDKFPDACNRYDVIFQMGLVSENKEELVNLGPCDNIENADVYKTDNEQQLMDVFFNKVEENEYDILVGHNIFGFDLPYISDRYNRTGLNKLPNISKLTNFNTTISGFTWSSSAFKNVTVTSLTAPGIVTFDTLPYFDRNYKSRLANNKLQTIGMTFLNEGKDDMDAKTMFKIYDSKDASEIARVGKYCLQDCRLLIKLFKKLNIFMELREMSNIMSTQIFDLYSRGQGLKVFNLLYSPFKRAGFYLQKSTYKRTSFKGGAVHACNSGIYKNVFTYDFAGLYPSIIRAHNYCISTLVDAFRGGIWTVPQNTSIPDSDCHVIEWTDDEDGGGYRRYRFIKKEIFEGVTPKMLTELAYRRAEVKEAMEKEKDPIFKAKLNAIQNAIKLAQNSTFGVIGNETYFLQCSAIAESITFIGRQSIHRCEELLRVKFGAIDVYGDSVTADTPILIRDTRGIRYITIDKLAIFVDDNEDKVRLPISNIEVWSDKGFTPIKYVMRHKVNKPIYRVLTHTGVVDVTSDHSMLLPNGNEIRPVDIMVGTELLHKDLPVCNKLEMDPDLAFVYGFFFAEGSCGYYECDSGPKSSWALNNQETDVLLKCKNILEKHEINNTFKLLDTMESSRVYKLVAKGEVKQLVMKWRSMFYDDYKNKIVPDCIMRGTLAVKTAFLDGYYVGDGDHSSNSIRLDCKGKIGSAQLLYLYTCIGYNCSINTRSDKPNIYRINCTKKVQRKHQNDVKKIYKIEYDGYVYDLETENHHFAAGIGKLVVHNTDSTMCMFPSVMVHPKVIEDKKMALTITGKIASDHLSSMFLKPMKIEPENWFVAAIYIKKKAYCCIKVYRKNINKPFSEYNEEFVESNGLVYMKGIKSIKKDNMGILAKVYRRIALLSMLSVLGVDNINMKYIMDYVYRQTIDLLTGKVPPKLLYIMNNMGKDYKQDGNALKVYSDYMASIGEPVAPGTSVEFTFIIIDDKELNKKAGPKMRSIDHVVKKNLPIDYDFCFKKRFVKPVDDLLSIIYPQIGEKLLAKRVYPLIVEQRTNGVTDTDVILEHINSKIILSE